MSERAYDDQDHDGDHEHRRYLVHDSVETLRARVAVFGERATPALHGQMNAEENHDENQLDDQTAIEVWTSTACTPRTLKYQMGSRK